MTATESSQIQSISAVEQLLVAVKTRESMRDHQVGLEMIMEDIWVQLLKKTTIKRWCRSSILTKSTKILPLCLIRQISNRIMIANATKSTVSKVKIKLQIWEAKSVRLSTSKVESREVQRVQAKLWFKVRDHIRKEEQTQVVLLTLQLANMESIIQAQELLESNQSLAPSFKDAELGPLMVVKV